jgi:Ca2+-transporting ATPase
LQIKHSLAGWFDITVSCCFISFVLNDIAEAIAILIVIILNAVVGFIMEWQALASLKCFAMI